MGDNGELKKKKTPEELKIEAFNKDPDMFVDMRELILAVKWQDGQLATLIGQASRKELMLAKEEIRQEVEFILYQMKVEARTKALQKNRIITRGQMPQKHLQKSWKRLNTT